jgi:hypothetical protein
MLNRLRGQAVKLWLTDSCTIQRAARGSNALMSPSENWSTVAVLPCRLIRASGGAMSEVGELSALGDVHKMALARGVNVQADDRVVIGENVFYIVGIEDDLSEAFFVHVMLSRKRGFEFR